MNREELIYLIPYLLSLALSLGIFIYAWRRQTVAGARPFAWLAATQAVWTFGFILELITPTLSGKLFWDKFQWVGAIVMPLIFPAFTIEYANFQIKRPRLVWGSLAAFPLILLLLVLTSGYHKLLYPNPHLAPGEPFSSLDYDFTALFWVASLYVYAIIIGCMIVLIQKFGRSFPLYRSQVFIIAVGAAFPILVTFLPLIGINITPQRDPTPFTFAVGNLIIAVGLFQYRLLSVVPIARERVLEDITDAIIVLDVWNRVVDMNHAALANVGKAGPEVIGRPAQEVFAGWPELREQTQSLDDATREVSTMVKGEHRIYELSISSIRDQMNRLIGRVLVARDITARKMLEERYRLLSEELEQRVLERTENLHVSESRLQAAIHAADIVLWERDLSSGHIAWLGHHEKLLGFAPGELDDNTLTSFENRVHPEDIEELRRIRQRALEERSEYSHEYRVIWRDGSIHWIRAQGRFIYNEAGQPVRLYGAVLDITDRKRLEEHLRKAELQYRTLVEQVPPIIYLSGLDQHIGVTYISPRIHTLGFTPQEWLADPELWFRQIHPEDQPRVLDGIEEGKKTGGVIKLEYRIRAQDGSTHWFLDEAVDVTDENGNFVFRQGIMLDITERKQAEEALQKSERVLREAETLGHTGSWEQNLMTGEIFNTEENLRLFFGDDRSKGANFEDYAQAVHPDDREYVARRRAELVEEEGPGDIEYRVVWPDGSIHVIFGRATVVRDEQGQAIRVYGTNIDITERKRAEEEIKRQAARSETLARIAARLNKQLDLEAVIHAVCEEAVNTFQVSQATMSLYDSKRDLLEYAGGVNIPPGYAAKFEPIDRAQFQEFVRTIGPILVVPDIQALPNVPNAEFSAQFDVRTVVTVDMRRDQQLIGVLVLGVNGQVREFDKDELTLLKAMSDQAAQAIANARLFQTVSEHADRMEALVEISRTFAKAGLDYQSILNTVARRAAEIIGDACVITLFSNDAQRSFPVAFHHPDPKAFSMMQEALMHTWQGGTDTRRYQTLLAGDSIYIPFVNPDEFQASLESEFWAFFEVIGISSVLIVPLKTDGHVIGTLGITRDRQGNPYTHDDQVLLQNIADRAALSIQNARLFEQVQAAREQLEALSRRLLEVQEAERRALTTELHDRVGQNLTGLSINLQNMKALLSQAEAQELGSKFDDAQALVEDTTRQIRDIMAELYLPELEDYGLAAALETYAERAASRGNLELIADLPDLAPPRLPMNFRIALFRAAQEAISNVLKHADATELEISLQGNNGRVHLRVEDDGQGFDPNAISHKEAPSWGLQIMRERVESIGGIVQIESQPGKGTQVTFEIERPS